MTGSVVSQYPIFFLKSRILILLVVTTCSVERPDCLVSLVVRYDHMAKF